MYSDYSFMTLGFIVEAITSQPMDQFVLENVYEPLGMSSTGYRPLDRGVDPSKIAAADLGVLLQCMLDGGEHDGMKLYGKDTIKLFTERHTTYTENHDGEVSSDFGYGFKLEQSWMGEAATISCFAMTGLLVPQHLRTQTTPMYSSACQTGCKLASVSLTVGCITTPTRLSYSR